MRVALDTAFILGSRCGEGHRQSIGGRHREIDAALAEVENVPVRQWRRAHGYRRWVGSSVKGRGGH